MIMLQLPLKRVAKSTRVFVPHSIFILNTPSPYIHHHYQHQFYPAATSTQIAVVDEAVGSCFNAKDVVFSFKEWFKRGNIVLLDRIFEVLSAHDEDDANSRLAADLALSQLNLRLSESFVLTVLDHGARHHEVLSCLKFFDWAGRQGGFHHTRVTLHAIFSILARAKLMSLVLDYLADYGKHRYCYNVSFYNVLVMGYAVAGKPDVALQVFGRMRFKGLDLDGFSYHVLLNALVEQSCFDAVEVVEKQIFNGGFENDITYSILVKNLCKQNLLDEAEAYLRDLVSRGQPFSGGALAIIVDALCKKKQYGKAMELMEEFKQWGLAPMNDAYGACLGNLVQAGKVEGALEFLWDKKSLEGYVPHLFRYNILLCKLLRESRLKEVCDLLTDMKENDISPDKVTMNAALCLFCKAGMSDVALELYNSRDEFGLSPNSLAFNYLINTLCGDGSIDEAYRVLNNSINQGYFPSAKTFSILADALCREGKIDRMKELVFNFPEKNFRQRDLIVDKFISALCMAQRVEDGYLMFGDLNRLTKVATRNTYVNLIHGFINISKGDFAARLLIEMQEKGYHATPAMFRAVVICLCNMENPITQFFKLLEMQLSRHEPNCHIYNNFIAGAGHAKKPELAREVFEMMHRSGIEPNISSDILMLQSYLKSQRISDASNFFCDLCQRRNVGRKLWNAMVVGLCKANRIDMALDIFTKMKSAGMVPSNECCEEVVKLLCSGGYYDLVVNFINELEKQGRRISSFIGNTLLFHSLRTQELYEAWVLARGVQDETSSIAMLGQLIGAFCGRLRVSSEHIERWEELIEPCFPLNLYTYNMLLRRLSWNHIDHACQLFNRICQKGYEPNQWTYDILIHGLVQHGRTAEARRREEEMFMRGFDPTVKNQRDVKCQR
ncbi:pentatricopeptide repeat-containing protein At1g71210, mitochondrial-like isoform X2 [Tripterygium wilfordii]|uniref:pentatricopeptide repeat-containing protein At1g71210, mitochondrial-like isoform X2 n=1 Tax=Tripterygium wilfordii TaxID=458696 RepID=UPI0018F8184F|nr:pentatricopeptide repeat-containing protein At1g71210, mitochondrial-like isoform X2 [Tripterygium wilfordii]XP_038694339.1 pentatricopeptide repeat-containing protein At1g71210, mitochondrial-like isoform X2 [Tripterygium wilfordii]XP_038694340.1 pentatricopeptide repeat-containing protein At1g71210, mitochondrial-like isoform X2 [Tripterygium wilfordii]XP_038694341.1 pentatricopeptide repeat-containing protein At1g71210, mitochondrial-like isoform X2 [Tripterygium wilfordii]XP_038694342.1 